MVLNVITCVPPPPTLSGWAQWRQLPPEKKTMASTARRVDVVQSAARRCVALLAIQLQAAEGFISSQELWVMSSGATPQKANRRHIIWIWSIRRLADV